MIFPIHFHVWGMRNLFISQPTAAIPSANAPILNPNPTYTTRTPSIVEPTLAPIIAPMAIGNVSNPAPANAKIISEVTELDCNNVVTPNELKIACNGVLASFFNRFFNVAPDRS